MDHHWIKYGSTDDGMDHHWIKYGSTDDGIDHHPWMVWINRCWNESSSLDGMDQQMMEWIIPGWYGLTDDGMDHPWMVWINR
jgi:hypothetical protein